MAAKYDPKMTTTTTPAAPQQPKTVAAATRSTTMNTAKTNINNTPNNNKHKSLGSLLRFLTGQPITVESKTGRFFAGTLAEADAGMNLTLEDATIMRLPYQRRPRSQQHHPFKRPKRDWQPPREQLTTTTTIEDDDTSTPVVNKLSLLSIRGSTIRYIHFPDHIDLVVTMKQGMEREKAASQKYARAVRKG